MAGRRLLERIRDMAANPYNRGSMDIEDLQESILHNLQSILNTRQGSALISNDFGVPDFSLLAGAFDFSEIAKIEDGIKKVIMRYEQRLKNIEIEFKQNPDDPLQMFFLLKADMVNIDDDSTVFFETILSSNGRFTIRRNN